MPVTNSSASQSSNQLIFREEWTDTPSQPGLGTEFTASSSLDLTLVLDTAPLAGNSQPIDTFGRGFYGPECDSGGRGDRWTNGRGHAYFFTRLEASEICLDFFSPFPDGTRLEMLLSRQNDPVQHSFANELHVEFWGKCNDVSRLSIPLKLRPATLYRLTLISPSIAPSVSAGEGNRLGVAVVSAKLLGRPFAAPRTEDAASVIPMLPAPANSVKAPEVLQRAARLTPPRRIAVTGDITRPTDDGRASQAPNISWFWNLLQYPVTRAVGSFPVGRLHYENDQATPWREIYRRTGIDVSEASWARLYSQTSLDPDCLELLDRTYEGSLVLGFELPELLIRYFLHRGIPYVDTIVHPGRFLDDVFLAFRTNVPEAFEALRTYAIPEEQLYVQAGIHAATIARMKPVAMPANSCLLLGQTKMDKSLIDRGRVLSFDDFSGELRRLVSEHSRLYFKPHPYAQGDAAIVRQLREEGALISTDANIYALFCNENISKVVGISSGSLFEAKYFGKKAQYLYRPSAPLANENSPFDPWACIGVYDAYYTPRFWADILAAVCPVDNCPEVSIPRKTSRLRTSLQVYWGYNFLDIDILMSNLQGKQVVDT